MMATTFQSLPPNQLMTLTLQTPERLSHRHNAPPGGREGTGSGTLPCKAPNGKFPRSIKHQESTFKGCFLELDRLVFVWSLLLVI
jgi:hypothetical protein